MGSLPREVFKVSGGSGYWRTAFTLADCKFDAGEIQDLWLVYFYTAVTTNIEFTMSFFQNDVALINLPLSYFANEVRLLPDLANPGMNPRCSLFGQIVSPMAIRLPATRLEITCLRGNPGNVHAAVLCSS